MEVTAGNDGALAAGIALAATMQSFVCTHETSHVGTNMAHRVLNSSTQEKCRPYHNKARRGKRLNYGDRFDVGLPPTKLLLRLTEQLLHVQQMAFVEATFPSKALGAVQV